MERNGDRVWKVGERSDSIRHFNKLLMLQDYIHLVYLCRVEFVQYWPHCNVFSGQQSEDFNAWVSEWVSDVLAVSHSLQAYFDLFEPEQRCGGLSSEDLQRFMMICRQRLQYTDLCARWINIIMSIYRYIHVYTYICTYVSVWIRM